MSAHWSLYEITEDVWPCLRHEVANTGRPDSTLLLWHTCEDDRPLRVQQAVVLFTFPPDDGPPAFVLACLYRHPIKSPELGWSYPLWHLPCYQPILVQRSIPDHETARRFVRNSGFLRFVESPKWHSLEYGCDNAAWGQLFGDEPSFELEEGQRLPGLVSRVWKRDNTVLGLMVNIRFRLPAFMPRSQIPVDLRGDLDSLVDRSVECLVLKIDEEHRYVVVCHGRYWDESL